VLSDDERRRHLALVEREQLASVMNTTKWEELAAAMRAFQPLPDWRSKDITAPGAGPWDAEWTAHLRPFHTIEWLEIGFITPRCTPGRPRLHHLTPIERADADTRLRVALSALGVPWSLEAGGVVRIWGYTRSGVEPPSWSAHASAT